MFETNTGKDVITNRIAGLGAVVTLLAMALLTFQLKYQVQDLKGQAETLKLAMAEERHSIDVLRAEWHMLNDPGRLEKLARKHLVIGPTVPRNILTFAALKDHQTSLGVQSAPFHQVKAPSPRLRPVRPAGGYQASAPGPLRVSRVSFSNYAGSGR